LKLQNVQTNFRLQVFSKHRWKEIGQETSQRTWNTGQTPWEIRDLSPKIDMKDCLLECSRRNKEKHNFFNTMARLPRTVLSWQKRLL